MSINELVRKDNMEKYSSTYCRGFRMTTNKEITTREYAFLCKSLNQKFGEGYSFIPESIGEGGIQMIKWPNKKEKEFKTMRINHHDVQLYRPKGKKINYSSGIQIKKWPWVQHREDILSIWEKEPITCIKADDEVEIWTGLKAFHGAPVWTMEELKIFCECLEEIGFNIIKSSLPKKKDLITYDRMCGDPRYKS